MSIIQSLIMDTSFYEPIKHHFEALSHIRVYSLTFGTDAYPSVAMHADVHACRAGEHLIVCPKVYDHLVAEGATGIKKGVNAIGSHYPSTCSYNALITQDYFIHNTRWTDPVVFEESLKRQVILVKQGYSRCTTLEIKRGVFVTSDPGIYEVLQKRSIQVYLISGDTIGLKDQEHGFIGGCAGVDLQGKLWLYGSLSYHPFGQTLRNLCAQLEIVVIELLDEPLVDVGGLIFW